MHSGAPSTFLPVGLYFERKNLSVPVWVAVWRTVNHTLLDDEKLLTRRLAAATDKVSEGQAS